MNSKINITEASSKSPSWDLGVKLRLAELESGNKKSGEALRDE
jgi:hypothetical protein